MRFNPHMIRRGPNSYRFGAWRQHVFSILVWLCAIAGVVGLFYHRSERFEVLGLAQGQVRQVAASCDGQLKSVPVQLFERVSYGQILAVLDDELLQAQLATVAAEIQRLMAQLIPTQELMLAEAANQETDWIADKRRFAVDVESIRLRILELKTLLETDRIMLEDLAVEVKITKDLLEKRAVAAYELQKAEAIYNVLAKKIEENERVLAQAEQQLKETQRRRSEFAQRLPQHPSVGSALELIRKEINVQEKLIDELVIQRKALIIKSPIDGVVIEIQCNANQVALRRSGESVLRMPGEVVLAGEPILTVAEAEPREVITYARQGQLGRVREKMTVELIKSSQPAQVARSQVCYIGPVIEQMPVRLWRNPNFPEWGRPMLIRIPPGMKLVPGELVGIRGL